MGVTYVPWDDLPTVNIDALAVGGMVDGDSLPEHMKSKNEYVQIPHVFSCFAIRNNKLLINIYQVIM